MNRFILLEIIEFGFYIKYFIIHFIFTVYVIFVYCILFKNIFNTKLIVNTNNKALKIVIQKKLFSLTKQNANNSL